MATPPPASTLSPVQPAIAQPLRRPAAPPPAPAPTQAPAATPVSATPAPNRGRGQIINITV